MLDFLFGQKLVKITTIREKTTQTSNKNYSKEGMNNVGKKQQKIYKNNIK